MIACKENLVFFEKLANRQIRLFGDACDMGVRLNERLKTQARHHLQELRGCYKSELERYNEKNTLTKVWVTTEKEEGMYHVLQLNVNYFVYKGDEYLCIIFRRKVSETSTFKDD